MDAVQPKVLVGNKHLVSCIDRYINYL